MSVTEAEKQLRIEQGQRMAEARIKLGFSTLKEFADHIGVSQATISSIERYERKISRKVFQALRDKFENLNTEWIRSGKGIMIKEDYVAEGKFSIVKDDLSKSYQHVCEECKKKDVKISELQSELDQVRKDYIECLRELSGLRKFSG